MNKQAHRAIISARTTLLIEHPFFGCLMSQLKPVEIIHPKLRTMATDGKHLFYSPQFVLEQTEDHLVGISAHEAYHCAYRHHIRMCGRDLTDWNKAGDYIINYDLRQYGFKLPNWVLYNTAYIGMSTEEVYNIIHEERRKQESQQKQGQSESQGGGQQPPQSGSQQGDQKGDKQAQGNEQSKGQGQGQNSNGQGQGSGAPQPGQGGQGNGEGGGQFDNIDAPDPGGMGGVIPAMPEHDKNGQAAEDARWEMITRQAVSVAKAQNAGRVPGFLERLVKDLGKPRIDWQTQMRQFTDHSISKEYTWMTPNRRHIHTGMVLPGMVPDKVHHIIGVMDTSGSINDKLVALYATEKRALLDDGICDKLTVIYSDVVVHNIQVFERGDELKLDPKGGGGTDFRDVFKRIAKDYYDATVVLFFTDLHVVHFGEDPGIPVLWCAYGDSRQYEARAKKVPFGSTIYIPTS